MVIRIRSTETVLGWWVADGQYSISKPNTTAWGILQDQYENSHLMTPFIKQLQHVTFNSDLILSQGNVKRYGLWKQIAPARSDLKIVHIGKIRLNADRIGSPEFLMTFINKE